MRWKWTEWHVLGALVAILAALFAAGWLTRNDPADQPAIVIAGGGFVFNYREAEAYLGFQAQVMRPLPAGSILEARFEDPAGGDDHVVWERLSARTRLYALRSPPLSEIKAHRPTRWRYGCWIAPAATSYSRPCAAIKARFQARHSPSDRSP